MKEKIFINKTGGCICGNITFKVKLDEVPLVFNCHCIDCRKKIGGIMTIILLRDGAIDIDKSKLKIYEHEGGSCLLYTSPSPRDNRVSRMPSSA